MVQFRKRSKSNHHETVFSDTFISHIRAEILGLSVNLKIHQRQHYHVQVLGKSA